MADGGHGSDEVGQPYWTVEEARAYLPRLNLLLGVIRRASHLVVNARGNGHATLPGSLRPPADGDPGPDPSPSPAAGSPSEELPVSFDAEAALEELQEKGIVLRDPDRGLIDFPALHPGGREVLLCWQLGEDDLAWWHPDADQQRQGLESNILVALDQERRVLLTSLLGTNCLEPNLWMGCAYFAILAIKRTDPRYWLWFGVIAGLAASWTLLRRDVISLIRR
jgi:hypothetical protein